MSESLSPAPVSDDPKRLKLPELAKNKIKIE